MSTQGQHTAQIWDYYHIALWRSQDSQECTDVDVIAYNSRRWALTGDIEAEFWFDSILRWFAPHQRPRHFVLVCLSLLIAVHRTFEKWALYQLEKSFSSKATILKPCLPIACRIFYLGQLAQAYLFKCGLEARFYLADSSHALRFKIHLNAVSFLNMFETLSQSTHTCRI